MIDEVLAELQRGYKQGCWMWFIFPQIKGLGTSWMAERYAISSRAEAEAYLEHPILSLRLIQCTELVTSTAGRSAQQIFGYVDTLKFRSSMTLFASVGPQFDVFSSALKKYFDGRPDQLTLDRL